MDRITEPERETPVLMKVDVVVAGAGPAGFAAAIAAARNGAEVVLAEETNFVGGLMAAMPMMGYYNRENKQAIFGIAQELLDRLVERGASPGIVIDPQLGDLTVTDSEMLKVVAQDMVEEAGAKLLLHTLVVAPVLEGRKVKGVIVENKSGRQAILADVVIDATGDGDVAARAGATFQMKDRDHIQPGTLIFRVDNVNVDKIRLAIAENPEGATTVPRGGVRAGYLKAQKFAVNGFVAQLEEAREKGDIPPDFPQNWVIINTQPREDEVVVNMAMAIGFHSTDAMDLTKAEMEARKRIPIIMNFLKKYIPGFEDAYLTASHSTIGVRESRRIMGDYILTAEDVMQNKKFPDGIAIATWGPSLGHHPKGKIWSMEYREKYSTEGLRGCEVPYRCLLPRGIEGLLVAGRCISVTGESQNAIRVIGPCLALGQAAGTAAAIAAKKGITPRMVDALRLRATLVRHGVYLLAG